MPLEINMNDPNVRSMLGADDARVQSTAPRKQMVQLAGDAQHGIASTTRLDTGKLEVAVVFGDHVMTMDVYAIPGEPIQVHYICPRCRKQGRITSERKLIEFDPRSTRPVRLPDGSLVSRDNPARLPDGGMLYNDGALSIEPFECTWELGDEQHTPGIRAGGIGLCRLTLGVDNNIARTA
jgi:hypothetical protein